MNMHVFDVSCLKSRAARQDFVKRLTRFAMRRYERKQLNSWMLPQYFVERRPAGVAFISLIYPEENSVTYEVRRHDERILQGIIKKVALKHGH